MTLLQINIQGTDAAGNIVTGTTEVQVNPAPAGDVLVAPPVMKTEAGLHDVAPPAAAAGPAAPLEAREQLPRMMEKIIPGFGNGVLSKHQGATPASVAPQVTQAVRSMTLFRNTGGYR